MKSIAPVCGVSEITRAILKHHYRFDYNSLAKIDLTSISTAFQSYLKGRYLSQVFDAFVFIRKHSDIFSEKNPS